MAPLPELAENFRLAATKSGAYDAQIAAGEAYYEALTQASSDASVEPLKTFMLELNRLIINISCRIGQRRPEILRPLRSQLTLLRRRVKFQLIALGVHSPPRSPRRSHLNVAPCELLDVEGPRHICEHGCYFREHEPSRLLHTFLYAAADRGHLRHTLSGWHVAVGRDPYVNDNDGGDGDAGDEDSNGDRGSDGGGTAACKRQRRGTTSAGPSLHLVSPSGRRHATIKEALQELGDALMPQAQPPPATSAAVVSRFFSSGAAAASCAPSQRFTHQESASGAHGTPAAPACANGLGDRTAHWRPPHSPFGLLEELLWDRPWRLLLCCILLNQTSRAQVRARALPVAASQPQEGRRMPTRVYTRSCVHVRRHRWTRSSHGCSPPTRMRRVWRRQMRRWSPRPCVLWGSTAGGPRRCLPFRGLS